MILELAFLSKYLKIIFFLLEVKELFKGNKKKILTDYQFNRNESKPKYWQSVSTVDSLNKYTFKCILTYLSNSAPVADIAWLGFRDIARRHGQTPLESTFSRCLSVLDFLNPNFGVYYKLGKKLISNQT